MIINLIRHGKTIANEKRLYCGCSDISLSEYGIEELKILKEKITYPTAEVYMTSNLKRAKETLKILYGKVEYKIINNFSEMNFGDFEMKSYDELKTKEDYLRWIENVEYVKCINGESKKEFNIRVVKSLKSILDIKKDVVVITHGGVISVIMDNIFKYEKTFYDWRVECGSGYSIKIDDEYEKNSYKNI